MWDTWLIRPSNTCCRRLSKIDLIDCPPLVFFLFHFANERKTFLVIETWFSLLSRFFFCFSEKAQRDDAAHHQPQHRHENPTARTKEQIQRPRTPLQAMEVAAKKEKRQVRSRLEMWVKLLQQSSLDFHPCRVDWNPHRHCTRSINCFCVVCCRLTSSSVRLIVGGTELHNRISNHSLLGVRFSLIHV